MLIGYHYVICIILPWDYDMLSWIGAAATILILSIINERSKIVVVALSLICSQISFFLSKKPLF